MASRSSSGSGSAQSTSYEPVVGSGSQELDGESCQYDEVDPAVGCRFLRSCSDCVRRTGCMISSDGMCADMYASDTYRDYHYARDVLQLALPDAVNGTNSSRLADNLAFVFPAHSTKYCPTDDGICSRCRDENFWTNNLADSRFCVGANGCVCVFNCELEVKKLPVECVSDDAYYDWYDSHKVPAVSTSTRLMLTLAPVAICAAFILVALLCTRLLKRRALTSQGNTSGALRATPVPRQPTSQAPVAGTSVQWVASG